MTHKVWMQDLVWDVAHNTNVYLYGSSLVFHDDGGMTFTNPRLASGKLIKVWESRVNYQGARKSPELPLLIEGETYEIHPDFETVPRHRAHIMIKFFNRQAEQVDFVVLRDDKHTFECPETTFFYTVTLVSAGCEIVHFKKLSLSHVTEKQIEMPQVETKRYAMGHEPEELNLIKNCLI